MAPLRVFNKVEETNSIVQELSNLIKEEQVPPETIIVHNSIVANNNVNNNGNSENKYSTSIKDNENVSVNAMSKPVSPSTPSGFPRYQSDTPHLPGKSTISHIF